MKTTTTSTTYRGAVGISTSLRVRKLAQGKRKIKARDSGFLTTRRNQLLRKKMNGPEKDTSLSIPTLPKQRVSDIYDLQRSTAAKKIIATALELECFHGEPTPTVRSAWLSLLHCKLYFGRSKSPHGDAGLRPGWCRNHGPNLPCASNRHTS